MSSAKRPSLTLSSDMCRATVAIRAHQSIFASGRKGNATERYLSRGSNLSVDYREFVQYVYCGSAREAISASSVSHTVEGSMKKRAVLASFAVALAAPAFLAAQAEEPKGVPVKAPASHKSEK